MLPALALGTGSYVRSTTATELQSASDSGSLAGASEIPLGNTTFVTDYVNMVTKNGLNTLLSNLGLNDLGAPNPLTDACAVALNAANDPKNLGHAYATFTGSSDLGCTAKYIQNDSAISQLTSCVANLAPANLGVSGLVLGLVDALLGNLGLGGLDNTLESLLPALLDPGVQVNMKWHVNAPFDSLAGSPGGSDQTSTSTARRRFKNILVIPSLSSTLPVTGTKLTVNPDAALQPITQSVFGVLGNVETLIGKIASLTGLSSLTQCVNALQNVQGDLSDLLDPPNSGPDLTSLLTQAAESNTPVLALVTGTGIPFLDFVPVCIPSATNIYSTVVAAAGAVGCLADAPGVFRASLRNS